MSAAEKIFTGMNIYYSGSIRGVPNSDPLFAWHLVQFMQERGADVLSEHVAARSQQEMDDIFAKRSGVDRRLLAQPWYEARRIDFDWVNKASHLVAVVNGPSHGVGMELQRAIDKPMMGMNRTPILCLAHQDFYEKVTWMIRGIVNDSNTIFKLGIYCTLQQAQEEIESFLLANK